MDIMKMLLFFLGSLMLCSCGPDKYPVSFHMETGATVSYTHLTLPTMCQV